MIRPEDIAAMHARRLRDVEIIHRNTNEVTAEEWRMAAAASLFIGLLATLAIAYVTERDAVDRLLAALVVAGIWFAVGLGAYAHHRHLRTWAGGMRDLATIREDEELERHFLSLGQAR